MHHIGATLSPDLWAGSPTPLRYEKHKFRIFMTRINCIPVQELTRQHLIAEYRELPRVFALARKAHERGPVPRPTEYTLGKGHLLFFYTRLGYLARRQADLVLEMQRRGYRPSYLTPLEQAYADLPAELWGDWQPTPQAQHLNRQRIAERGGPAYAPPAPAAKKKATHIVDGQEQGAPTPLGKGQPVP